MNSPTSRISRCLRSRAHVVALAALLAIGTVSHAANATIWYVDPQAVPPGDGSISSPFVRIAQARGVVQAGDTIRLAAGVFEDTSTLTVGSQTRRAVAILVDGVILEGAGTNQTFLRAPASTTLTFGVTAAGVGATTVVRDLTIDGLAFQGINLRGASPTIQRVDVRNLAESGSTVAIDVREASFPTVTDCVFDGGHSGLFIEFGSGGRYERCEVGTRPNETVSIVGSNPELIDCILRGGGRDTMTLTQGSAPTLTRCTIYAGARYTIRVHGYPQPTIIDLSGNTWIPATDLPASIFDAQDDPSVGGTVDYLPLAEPVAVGPTSVGQLKARF